MFRQAPKQGRRAAVAAIVALASAALIAAACGGGMSSADKTATAAKGSGSTPVATSAATKAAAATTAATKAATTSTASVPTVSVASSTPECANPFGNAQATIVSPGEFLIEFYTAGSGQSLLDAIQKRDRESGSSITRADLTPDGNGILIYTPPNWTNDENQRFLDSVIAPVIHPCNAPSGP
jgi:hypothetical protein